MATFYLVRHAETEANCQNVFQGRYIDGPLNAKGFRQATLLARAYYHMNFDAIFTSTLKRTLQTVEPMIGRMIVKPAVFSTPDLDEMGMGILEGKQDTDKTDKLMKELRKQWKLGNLDAKVEEGESYTETLDRVEKALKSMIAQTGSGRKKKILVCTHARTLNALFWLMENHGKKERTPLIIGKHRNTGVTIVHFDGIRFEFLKRNDASHLQ